MNNNFTTAMQFVAKWEWMNRSDGAYTNDPKDPGGETKFGISARAHPNIDIQNLSLPDALQIYFDDYWQAFSLDLLELPLAVAAFDSYVQHRPAVVAKLLKDAGGDLRKFLELRRVFYLNLIGKDPSLLRFKNGWLARVNDLSKFCFALQDQPSSTPLSS